MIYYLDNVSRAWTRLKNMSMSRLFLDTLLKHIVNVDTSYPKYPEYPCLPRVCRVNLYPVELKNIPLGLSKKRIFMTNIATKLRGFCHPPA